MTVLSPRSVFFFFNDTATTEIYTLSLHDALPICSDSVYSGAGTFSSTSLSGFVGTSATYVYVCINVTNDTTPEGVDIGNIYFDPQHNGGLLPQSDDRKFGVFSNTSVLVAWKGDGTAWIPCATTCDGGDAANG